ncbi:hypothetical protein PM082_024010 [Marasmius tenuissimus]|nr:hypothetical protein PM082_024010 [Marasmius tenuissimus]
MCTSHLTSNNVNGNRNGTLKHIGFPGSTNTAQITNTTTKSPSYVYNITNCQNVNIHRLTDTGVTCDQDDIPHERSQAYATPTTEETNTRDGGLDGFVRAPLTPEDKQAGAIR